MPTYLLIAGTRPEAIKLSPVAAALREEGAVAEFCTVGQHGDLLLDTLAELGERPRHTLFPFQVGRTPEALLERILSTLPPLLTAIAPDGVIVQGDTTSALGGALSAFYQKRRLIHVEAGLRTYSPAPFPEEAHRRMIAPLADLHLCPTKADADALSAERVQGRIAVTGNSGLDALRWALSKPTPPLPDLCGKAVLCTLHRRETAPLLPAAMAALRQIADAIPDCRILFPAHPSAAVEIAQHPAIQIIPPLSYSVCAHLLPRLTLLITDSGGLQEEAAYLGVPTLVFRESSERGLAPSLQIIGSDPSIMAEQAIDLLASEARRTALCIPSHRYGDGFAARRMAREILS